MIRFVYPNVDEYDRFAGCGRYLTTSPEDPGLNDQYHLVGDPNITEHSTIIEIVSRWAREVFESDQEVYEYKDQPAATYLGDSKGLAYLLALIKRARKTRWEQGETSFDLWCTGSINSTGQGPRLKEVYSNLFDVKLNAFITAPESVFLLPVANLQPKHRQMLKERDIPVLSVEQFAACSVQSISTGKIVVKIHPDELEALVSVIFQQPAEAFSPLPQNPYRGLFAFREEDAQFFFGRETYIARLCEALRNNAFIALIGASGSGKTSLVYAGLIPQLRRQVMLSGDGTSLPSQDGQSWIILPFRPSERPFYGLAAEFIAVLEPELDPLDQLDQVKKLHQKLAFAEFQLTDIVDALMQKYPDTNVLLFADQFEELYTLCRDERERCRFLDQFLAINGQHEHLPRFRERCKVLLTMRADFLGKALMYRPFADVLQACSVMLGPMTREELQHVIKEPATACGVTLEDGLTDRLLEAVGEEPGNLPLLEFALTEMWSKQSQRVLTHQAYEAIGGVEHALAAYAEGVYTNLSDPEQRRLQQIFIQLIRPGEGTEDTRRIATRTELGETHWGLVTKLANARLVVTNRSANFNLPGKEQTEVHTPEETVEVVHEALITRWQRLREWMEAHREFRVWQERLRSAMRQWQASYNDEGALLRGALLAEAEHWLAERRVELSREEQQFIEAGLRLRDREAAERETQRRKSAQRSKIFSGIIAVIAFIAIFFWIQAEKQRQEAEAQRQIAIQRSIESFSVAARTFLLSNKQLEAVLTTVKAGNMFQQAEVPVELEGLVLQNFRDILNGVYEKNRFERVNAKNASVFAISFTPDGKRLVSGNSDGAIVLWDVRDGRPIMTFQEQGNLVNAVDVSPDGTQLAAADSDGIITLWNMANGERSASFPGHSDIIYSVKFSPDGKLLASASEDMTVALWNLVERTKIMTFQEHHAPVLCLAFSPDGVLLASGSDDATIKLWDLNSGRSLQTFSGHSASVRSIHFSPDSKQLVSGSTDRTVRLWRVDDGLELNRFDDHDAAVTSVNFSPNGAIIASGSHDRTIKLWSVNNGTQLITLRGHEQAIQQVSFSPDNTLLASASGDMTVRLWQPYKIEVSPQATLDDLLSRGCAWIAGYISTNPHVMLQDRSVCDDKQ